VTDLSEQQIVYYYYYSWLFFRYLLITVIVLFFIGGIDDIFMDLSYYLRLLYRKIFKKNLIRPLTLSQISSVPEKPIAIMIPAWHESRVIKKMLLNTIGSIDYRNYYIFVGVYPNDPDTQKEVEEVRKLYKHVVMIVSPHDGPTNKADCLNNIYRNIPLFEEQSGIRFEIFVMHDAEDIVHPKSLKMFNYLMPRMRMVQLPVLALEVPWYNFTGGVYMDEFVELHLKNLRARELITRTVPSAGVGTAFLRADLERLNTEYGFVFNPGSMAEDYEISIRLSKLGIKQIILHQFLERVVTKKAGLVEVNVRSGLKTL
jgi:adsorption protein B